MLISYSYPKLRAIRHTINIEGAGKNISVQSRKVKRVTNTWLVTLVNQL